LPGEVAQVDWADFGKFEVSQGVFRRLQCFVMTLAYSRKTFARFYYHQKMGAVLEGHVEAFDAFGGIPRRIVYDNMKTAVITNLGRGVEFNPSLLQMAGHYHFECLACTPRAAWQKGRVERTIRYIRENFAPESRQFRSIDELNLQLSEWLYEVANRRPWPDDHNRYVNDVFEEEKARLLPLQPSFPFYDELYCVVNKKSMIQFDCNLYTVPPQYVGQTLTVRATSGHLQVYCNENLIITHRRSWSKAQKIIIPEHIDAVIAATKSRPNYQNRSSIIKVLKSGTKLIDEWVKIGESLSRQSKLVGDLIEAYSAETVDAAVELALEQGTPRAYCISQILIGQPRHHKPNFLRSDLDYFNPGKHDLSTYDHL
jgi:ribosomal protein S19